MSDENYECIIITRPARMCSLWWYHTEDPGVWQSNEYNIVKGWNVTWFSCSVWSLCWYRAQQPSTKMHRKASRISFGNVIYFIFCDTSGTPALQHMWLSYQWRDKIAMSSITALLQNWLRIIHWLATDKEPEALTIIHGLNLFKSCK